MAPGWRLTVPVGFRDKSCPDEHVQRRVLITVLRHSAMLTAVCTHFQSDWRIGYLPAFGAGLRGVCRTDRNEFATVLDGLPLQYLDVRGDSGVLGVASHVGFR